MIAEKALREGLVAALDMVIDLDSRVEQLEARVNMLCSEPWEAPCAEKRGLPDYDDVLPPGVMAPGVVPPVVMAPIPKPAKFARVARFVDPKNGGIWPWHVDAPRGAVAVTVNVEFTVDKALPELPYDESYNLFRLYSDKNPPLFLRMERNRVYAAVGNGRIELDASILPGQTYEVKLEFAGDTGKVRLSVHRVGGTHNAAIGAPYPTGLVILPGEHDYDVVLGDLLLRELRVNSVYIDVEEP